MTEGIKHQNSTGLAIPKWAMAVGGVLVAVIVALASAVYRHEIMLTEMSVNIRQLSAFNERMDNKIDKVIDTMGGINVSMARLATQMEALSADSTKNINTLNQTWVVQNDRLESLRATILRIQETSNARLQSGRNDAERSN